MTDDYEISPPAVEFEPEWAPGVRVYAGLRASMDSLLDETGLRSTLMAHYPTASQFDVAGKVIDYYLLQGMTQADKDLAVAKTTLAYGDKSPEAMAIKTAYNKLSRRVRTIRGKLRAEVYGVAPMPTPPPTPPPALARSRTPDSAKSQEIVVSTPATETRAMRVRVRKEDASADKSDGEEEDEGEGDVPEQAQLYETPDEYTHALVSFLKANAPDYQTIYDPAMGCGAILDYFESHGYAIVGSDLYTTDCPHDFLSDEPLAKSRYDMLVINPPFQKTQDFLRRAIETSKPFAQLMIADSLVTLGVSALLSDGLTDVIYLPKRHPFKHNGRCVQIRPCLWVVFIPGVTGGRYLFHNE